LAQLAQPVALSAAQLAQRLKKIMGARVAQVGALVNNFFWLLLRALGTRHASGLLRAFGLFALRAQRLKSVLCTCSAISAKSSASQRLV